MRMKQMIFFSMVLFLLVWVFFTVDARFSKTPSCESLIKTAVSASQIPEPKKLDEITQDHADAAAPFASSVDSNSATDVGELDRRIQELESLKRGFEARALRHDDQAQRLQFEDRAVLETRRHNDLAEENRLKAQKVQEEIDRLQAEKNKLLQKTQ